MPTEKQRLGRLAFRTKGKFWVAYYAQDHTMNGALELGRIRMVSVERPDRKNQFMDLMRDAFGDVVQLEFGFRPEWDGVHAAPEHERGNAP